MKGRLRLGEKSVAHLDTVVDRENSREHEYLRLDHQAIGFGRHRAPQVDRLAFHSEVHRVVALGVERAAQGNFARGGMSRLPRLARLRHSTIPRGSNSAVARAALAVGPR